MNPFNARPQLLPAIYALCPERSPRGQGAEGGPERRREPGDDLFPRWRQGRALRCGGRREPFALFRQRAEVASRPIPPAETFRSSLSQRGICVHPGSGGEFRPFTAGADPAAPECPCCLNNEADSFATLSTATEQAAGTPGPQGRKCSLDG